MTGHDAVFAVALYLFAEKRKEHGEQATPVAAEKIAAMATRIGIHPRLTPAELGFTDDFSLSEADQRHAMRRVFQTRSGRELRKLRALLDGLTVGDVEGYEALAGLHGDEETDDDTEL